MLVLVLVLVANLARAADAPSTPGRVDEAARFAELVRAGDKARAAGKLSEAVSAYSAALQIRRDARIRGRLGLVALEAGATAEAVGFLLDAIMDGHGAPPAEQRQIHEAYLRARPLVCRLDITVSHLGAEVRIDGELEPGARTKNDFFVFVEPGKHEVRASLPGFADAIVNVEAPKGERAPVALNLTPLPAPSSPPAPEPPAASRPASSARSSTPGSKPRRWTPFVGTTVIYSAVSPLPAFGAVAFSEWPVGEVFSWRLDVRGAFSPRDESVSVRGALVGAWPGFCGTARWFSGCLLAVGGAINRSRIIPAVSEWQRFLGFGAGAMAAVPLGPLNVRILLDAVVLVDNYPLVVGGGPAGWSDNQIMAGLSVMAAVR
ncbi:tetratricopeptide repeat protein [Polyangium sp. 15x6]|uniref:tetratricopeptide repeat protein n=1 Tax=Polyangium sp. 15x6 TaxID=3042687 RepID=UPI00249C4DE0|nr:tetratricopeptide repeat protein [Polyangium sp. 15x6]MDI3290469.1 tetratricopeptide repeat protein [Polyangium sp. 15x6]